MIGVVLLKIVTLKLNENETPEYRTPKGKIPTNKTKTIDEIAAIKREKTNIPMIMKSTSPEQIR